eukprot:jgi/Botrbrau1/10441/Bobra.0133s0048.1
MYLLRGTATTHVGLRGNQGMWCTVRTSRTSPPDHGDPWTGSAPSICGFLTSVVHAILTSVVQAILTSVVKANIAKIYLEVMRSTWFISDHPENLKSEAPFGCSAKSRRAIAPKFL